MTGSDYDSSEVRLCRLPSANEVETVVHRYSGASSGPTVYIHAAQHGREMTGTAVIRRLHDHLYSTELSGEVVTVPVANPLTFDRLRKTVGEELDSSQPNMNRVWPGDENGTLHERMVSRLWEVAREADLIVDLHSISPIQLPHVRITEEDRQAWDLARVFGTEMVVSSSIGARAKEAYEAGEYSGTIGSVAYLEGIPHLTPEIGFSRQLTPAAVEAGVEGIMNVLRYVDVLPKEPLERDEPVPVETHLASEPADESGLFVPDRTLELGHEVSADERLGAIIDPLTFEPLQEVTAHTDGFIWYIGREGAVVAGDGVVGVAVPAPDRFE